MSIHLTTSRLTLRRLTADDLGNLVELNSDPEVMRYFTGGEPMPSEQVRDVVLPTMLAYYERGDDFGFWAATDSTTSAFLGWFHFRPGAISREGIELGYRFSRRTWGKGYATEGSRALIAKGFTEAGVQRVFAETMAANTASRRVMEKAGLRHVATGEQGKVRYALTRAEWQATVAPG
ncbi:GNAT family N-acetyltransferase [Actinoplanes derwentensis]|uniref:Protein N-acetyltransferase, RimJ/RimL family n=1 Tax=Actinoplanes derwentensis TaxID=113562 RepID=A0A1H1YMQ6_9ACTN|nr:GNAT family N-acetyltransferase [Actinoplanes derwentensis]GID81210.1 GNAT family acetyltransferase [Actinoplanes derwentensis]SDT22684.1 Protein N-acetyltransferase, RimJ/RimL family [Actinoplanes derwentensis]